MTTNGIIEVARRILQDTVSPYRWDDAQLKKDLQFGVRELHKIRPETRYVYDSDAGRVALVDCVMLPDDNDTAIDLDERFEECLAYYVVYLAYLNDDSDTVNAQLAENYLAKFNTKAQL